MNTFFSMCLFALTKLPIERIFAKRPDPMESVKKLEEILKSRQPLSSPINQAEKPGPLDMPTGRIVTTAETIAYQKRELGKEILLLEKHLQQKCKIGGIACDCCAKHPIAIEALAQEALGMSDDPIFSEIAIWIKGIAPMTTEAASKSGKFDDQYPKMAIKARLMRKNLMGTEEVRALLSTEQEKKVSEQVEEILGRSINTKGEGNGD